MQINGKALQWALVLGNVTMNAINHYCIDIAMFVFELLGHHC